MRGRSATRVPVARDATMVEPRIAFHTPSAPCPGQRQVALPGPARMADALPARTRRSRWRRRCICGSARRAASLPIDRVPTAATGGNAAVVHDFCWFLVLFSESEEGQLGGLTRATAMNFKAAIIAACLALATPAAAQSRGEVITPNLEQAIPNIPGKSLVAVVVDYAPGGASH